MNQQSRAQLKTAAYGRLATHGERQNSHTAPRADLRKVTGTSIPVDLVVLQERPEYVFSSHLGRGSIVETDEAMSQIEICTAYICFYS